ncbi:accessory Sec system glycosylation chaperone GtfB [Leuconostoc suionicum]|uniref:accessory Sec system glycosylation chaperone GtfB n=1 Tax=Leuconostoc suionicum TaxID=1511761 RepID=UPI004035788C
MINLFDNYSQASCDLHESLLSAGYTQPTVVIEDDGFLPDNVTSPFAYYTNIYNHSGHPIFFNQVECPKFWEIRGDNNNAAIYEENKRRANIIYVPNINNKRYVKQVEWLDLNNNIRSVDHYSKGGIIFAKTSYNLIKHPTITTYYNANHNEIIVENHITKDIILNFNRQICIFKSRTEFVSYYLKHVFGDINRIFYNSLSVPFLVSYNSVQPGNDLLFWQEPLSEDGTLPGNMLTLLQNQGRTKKVIFENKNDYEKVHIKYPEFQKYIACLGLLYPVSDKPRKQLDALILTNSDRIAEIVKIIETLPDINFHIAAITEMSSKLINLSKYKNVNLYPNIEYNQINGLLQNCAFYLDINYGNEISYAVRQAFLNNLLILSFEDTKHNSQFTLPEYIFKQNNGDQLIKIINQCKNNREYLLSALYRQQKHANQSSISEYQDIIG